MNTSYFAKYKGENAVSIAGKCPDWFKGRQYKKLAPKWHFFKKYKDTLNDIKNGKYNSEIIEYIRDEAESEYMFYYVEEVLNKLDAKQVYEELGENTVLLCWERSSEFCHRHIVRWWFQKELGIEVNELK